MANIEYSKCGIPLVYDIQANNGQVSSDFLNDETQWVLEDGRSIDEIGEFDKTTQVLNITLSDDDRNLEGKYRTRLQTCNATSSEMYETYIDIKISLCPSNTPDNATTFTVTSSLTAIALVLLLSFTY